MEEKLISGNEQTNSIIDSIVDTIDTFVKEEVSSLKDRVQEDLQSEVQWRKNAISKVNQKLDNETTSRIADVNNERDRAKSVEGNLSKLNKNSLADAIYDEIDRSIKAEQSIIKSLAQEVVSRREADTTINNQLNDEISNRVKGDETLTQSLNSEINRATSVENRLQQNIDLVSNQSVKLQAPSTTQRIQSAIAIKEELSVEGESSFKDNVGFNKNVVVVQDATIQGNLFVQGTTYSEDRQTLQIKDDIIITRSNATYSPTDATGLVMKVNNANAMAIVYEPSNDSVNLSIGQVYEDNQSNNEHESSFRFQSRESHPIVIRPDSNSISNDNLVLWQKSNNSFNGINYTSVKAIDSGISKSTIISMGEDIDSLNTRLDDNIDDVKVNYIKPIRNDVEEIKQVVYPNGGNLLDRVTNIEGVVYYDDGSTLQDKVVEVESTFESRTQDIDYRIDGIVEEVAQQVLTSKTLNDRLVELEESDEIDSLRSELTNNIDTVSGQLSWVESELKRELESSINEEKTERVDKYNELFGLIQELEGNITTINSWFDDGEWN